MRILTDINNELQDEAMRAKGERAKKGTIPAALEEAARRMRDEELVRQLKDGMLKDLADPNVIRSSQR